MFSLLVSCQQPFYKFKDILMLSNVQFHLSSTWWALKILFRFFSRWHSRWCRCAKQIWVYWIFCSVSHALAPLSWTWFNSVSVETPSLSPDPYWFDLDRSRVPSVLSLTCWKWQSNEDVLWVLTERLLRWALVCTIKNFWGIESTKAECTMKSHPPFFQIAKWNRKNKGWKGQILKQVK